ncbi:hypothetical protein BDV27DRAFT_123080 [Aspergillus caelatus]|uniref:SMODS and SLOG-associating 2TM effector domain-containing protein n=1 Tax=Aspergillus caelatus TaxID=61420 RepID=A0A5N7AFQ3_9EURO|nr:uncharacterized protein BDV27DRAFT_123080 [Aspergillus caelatus]KAE8367996.1 hypothetical protein BDV27DRAFT_123080 [Aspergillus caelatus]
MSNTNNTPTSQPAHAGLLAEEAPTYQTFTDATDKLYKKLVQDESREWWQYRFVSMSFNLLAIVQVMVGASITALGPFGGQHLIAVTVLGAINTVIAGFIALLKGRGLPQRPRKNMLELRRVREYIEQKRTILQYRNRRFSRDEVDSLLEDVMRRYDLAEEVIERNQPDTYTDSTGSTGRERQPDEERGPG